jgi:hypothetical protein
MIMGFVLALEKANRRCFASNAYFAKLCNVSSSTTQRAVRRLVNRGLLRHCLMHRSGTQRLLSINTAQLDAEVHTALHYASAQSLRGKPPKTMLAPDLRPKTSAETTPQANTEHIPPPMTLEEEYLYKQMEKDLLYCREMAANVSAVVHHLEEQQIPALERVEALIQEQVRLVQEQFTQASLPFTPQESSAQAIVPPAVPNSVSIESETTNIPTTAPANGDVCPEIQPIAASVQEAPHHIDEPPQQSDEAPRHFDDPIYTQFHSQKSSYKKKQGESNEEKTYPIYSDSSSKVVVPMFAPKEPENEENASPVCIEAAVQEHSQEHGHAYLNALQTVLSTLKTRANERRKAAQRPSPSPTQPISAGTQQPYPQHYGRHQHTSHGKPYHKPQKPQTFYQKQGQQSDKALRDVMTFQELPHGTMFVWEGSGNVYGLLRKLDDDHALRLENNKTIRVENLQGRVEVQRR